MSQFITPNRLFLSLITTAILIACTSPESSAPQNKTSTPAPTSTPNPEAKVQTAAANSGAKADPLARGAKLYKRCKTCHTLDQGGKHRVGPNLWNLYGSTAGTKEDFAYSKVMKTSGIVWDDETLNGYIENPRKYMPGNRMTYVGLRKPEDRKAVLAYIKARTSSQD